MMEVGFAEIENSIELPPQEWEKVGEKIFWGSAIIAGTAFVPALLKKKRIYTPMLPVAQGGGAAPIEPPNPEALPEALQYARAEEKIVQLWTLLSNDGSPGQEETIFSNPGKAWGIGAELENLYQIHPFANFMAIPKEKLRTVFNNPSRLYKWARIPTILWGIGKGMRKAMGEERPLAWPNLESLIPRFAREMGKDADEIRRLIRAADWERLVYFLFDIEAE